MRPFSPRVATVEIAANAATRPLLNTAKLVEDKPIAARIKDRETRGRVAQRVQGLSGPVKRR